MPDIITRPKTAEQIKQEAEWERQEVEYIREHYKTDSVTQMADSIGRSVPFILLTISKFYEVEDDTND